VQELACNTKKISANWSSPVADESLERLPGELPLELLRDEAVESLSPSVPSSSPPPGISGLRDTSMVLYFYGASKTCLQEPKAELTYIFVGKSVTNNCLQLLYINVFENKSKFVKSHFWKHHYINYGG
jgi:hypothetical protein